MRFEIERCPKCDGAPAWISEWLATQYEIEQGSDDGEFDYTGNHDDGSFESKLDVDRRGRVELLCRNGHDWRTRLRRERRRRTSGRA